MRSLYNVAWTACMTHTALLRGMCGGPLTYAWLPVVNPGVEGNEVNVRGGVVCNSILPCGWHPALPPSCMNQHSMAYHVTVAGYNEL